MHTALSRASSSPVNEPTLPRQGSWREALTRWGPLVTLLVLVALTGYLEPSFLGRENLVNILRQQSFVGILAIGMTVVIISGGIDLSVGALMALAGGCGIWVMNTALSAARILADNASARARHAEDLKLGIDLPLDLPYSAARESIASLFTHAHLAGSESAGLLLAFGTTLLVATAAGVLNGLLITKGQLAPFIATLGGLAAYRSLTLALADGGEFRAQGSSFALLSRDLTLGPVAIPVPVIVFLSVAVIVAVMLGRTRFGRYVYAIGNNERAAVYSAIRVDWVKLRVYMLMGLLVGIAACLLSSRMNSVASGTTGSLAELDAIAAVVIGGTSMRGGAGRVSGTIVGVLLLGVVAKMLNFLNVSPYLQGLVQGAIIVAAVLLQSAGRAKR